MELSEGVNRTARRDVVSGAIEPVVIRSCYLTAQWYLAAVSKLSNAPRSIWRAWSWPWSWSFVAVMDLSGRLTALPCRER